MMTGTLMVRVSVAMAACIIHPNSNRRNLLRSHLSNDIDVEGRCWAPHVGMDNGVRGAHPRGDRFSLQRMHASRLERVGPFRSTKDRQSHQTTASTGFNYTPVGFALATW